MVAEFEEMEEILAKDPNEEGEDNDAPESDDYGEESSPWGGFLQDRNRNLCLLNKLRFFILIYDNVF